jgi:DNA-binding NtrC family response regulator
MNRYKLVLASETKVEWNVETYLYAGSDSACGIQLTDDKVEKKHALIELREQGLHIKDLRSQHGVFLNGARVYEAQLNDGDLLTLGGQELIVYDLEKVRSEFSLKSQNEYWNNQLLHLGSVAETQFPVLLLGPSGTGKDVIAQSLHQHSKLSRNPLISVNCSALTETLVESELFGHVKGSFTGAVSDRKGAFETARGGTLFLDEIGDLPYSLQAKLLRALENNEIRPVGSDKPVKTNVRIISATHQNLYQKIREGSFRSDLFYRLNVITVDVPALKERMEDFETLVYQFAKVLRVRFSHGAIAALKKHDWPGNIRELKNVVARSSALFPKEHIQESHIDILLNKKEKLAHPQTGTMYIDENSNSQLSVIKEIEKQMIIKRLMANQGNQKRTASDLGMPKSTLHDRIKNYNIKVKEFRAD